ncbi:MAG: gfo/Idh/MocA family oxidoreductase [Spirochaetaceae bacterium]|nr:MAG: gfo/Idh/MocA family oxidoreductase [Spirochaetaceae bacterium]
MAAEQVRLDRALRYGMVGGGPGAFIGDVHRRAIALDPNTTLVSGVFSRNHESSMETARALLIDGARVYRDYREMATAEAARDDGIDFVVIVTPNVSHFEIAKAFLEAGIHVVCDKPLTTKLEDAEELGRLVKSTDLLFGVTYTYTGYPTVKYARELIRSGALGPVRFVNAEYPQEWLSQPAEQDEGNRQAGWRTDPAQSGASNCVGDIGTHVENMVSYVTGLEIDSLAARLDSFVSGRKLDDNATIMVNYRGGATGVYWSSQVAIGYDNALRVRVFAEKGAVEFAQEDPNYLRVTMLDAPKQLISRGRDSLGSRGDSLIRIPAGHPEGYFEAFANIYKTFTGALRKRLAGAKLDEVDLDFPSVNDGIQGVRFVTRVVESSQRKSAWVNF